MYRSINYISYQPQYLNEPYSEITWFVHKMLKKKGKTKLKIIYKRQIFRLNIGFCGQRATQI